MACSTTDYAPRSPRTPTHGQKRYLAYVESPPLHATHATKYYSLPVRLPPFSSIAILFVRCASLLNNCKEKEL